MRQLAAIAGCAISLGLVAIAVGRGPAEASTDPAITGEHAVVPAPGARLLGRDLSGARLRGAELAGADLRLTRLVKADLRDADLSRADLRGANLTRADLRGADLTNARLQGTRLVRTRMHRAVLIRAKLADAVVVRPNLSEATLNGADLRRVNLAGANLVAADLSSADLRQASLVNANLRGAGLAGADLRGTAVTGAAKDRRTTLPTGRSARPPVRSTALSTEPPWRFVVIPDFTNQDVDYPSPDWDPAMDYFLDRVAAERPEFVAVPGDLVMGHWAGGGAERVARDGARYFSAWQRRMDAHGLKTYVSVGDHDIGDNPWVGAKAALVPEFRRQFVAATKMPGNGPPGLAGTAYSIRHKNVQLIAVDPWEQYRPGGPVAVGVTGAQLDWFRSEVAASTADHIVVMGHPPVLTASHRRFSSAILNAGGGGSAFWQAMEQARVRLYLAGEWHDVSTAFKGGVTQVVSGSLPGVVDEINYLLVTVHPDRLELELKSVYTDIAVTGPPPEPDEVPPVRVTLSARTGVFGGPLVRARMTLTPRGPRAGREGLFNARYRALR